MDAAGNTESVEMRSLSRAYTVFVWAFLLLVLLPPRLPFGPVGITLMPPILGWLLMRRGLAALPDDPRVTEARRWALRALVCSVFVTFVWQAESNGARAISTGIVLVANTLMSVCGVLFMFPLMGYTGDLAKRMGSRVVAAGAGSRAVMFLVALAMPYVSLLATPMLSAAAANNSGEESPAGMLIATFVTTFIAALMMTAIMSYMGSVARLCAFPASRDALGEAGEIDMQMERHMREDLYAAGSQPDSAPAAADEPESDPTEADDEPAEPTT